MIRFAASPAPYASVSHVRGYQSRSRFFTAEPSSSPALAGATSVFAPSATVSCHSVSVRIVTHRTPIQYASRCTPPESVIDDRRVANRTDHLEVTEW